MTGHAPRAYLGAVRAYPTWLQGAETDGDPLNDAAAMDWAVHDPSDLVELPSQG